MSTKMIARVLLTLGFLAASVGYSSWMAERTVFDPSATRGATQALLATPAVQTLLTREIRTSLQPALGAGAATPKLTAAINSAVEDPKFEAAFENAIESLHEAILTGGNGQVTLDTAAVTNAIDQAVARVDPAAVPKVEQVHAVTVPLGSSQIPHIGDVGHTARRVADTAIALAIVLILGALVLAPNRKTLRRVGRRTLFLAIPPALIFIAAPHLMTSSHNSAMAVSAAILQAFSRRVTLSIIVLAVAGASTWIITIVLPKRLPEDAPSEIRSVPASRVPPPDTRVPSSPTTTVPEKLYL